MSLVEYKNTGTSSGSLPATRFHDVGLVIAAGGLGTRFGGDKLLAELDGEAVLLHSLRRFLPLFPPGQVVLVVSPRGEEAVTRLLLREKLAARLKMVHGGAERQDSVLQGLLALPETVAIAAIHDAARPRTSIELMRRCVESCRTFGSGVAAVRARDTMKVVGDDLKVVETLDRRKLCAAETPQVFDRESITAAYREMTRRGILVTDDAQAMELAGHPVYLVIHDEDNRKLTLPSDLPSGQLHSHPVALASSST